MILFYNQNVVFLSLFGFYGTQNVYPNPYKSQLSKYSFLFCISKASLLLHQSAELNEMTSRSFSN